MSVCVRACVYVRVCIGGGQGEGLACGDHMGKTGQRIACIQLQSGSTPNGYETYLPVYEQQVAFLAGQGHEARSSRVVHVDGHHCSRGVSDLRA